MLWASFAKKKRLWPKPLFWVSFAEIQPFWQKHTVLSRFRQNNAIWRFCHFEQLFLKSSRFCLKRRFWAGFAEIEPVWQIKQFPAAFPRLKQFPKITVLRSFYQKKAIFAKTTVLSIFAIFPFCAALSKSQPFLPQKVAAHDLKWAFCTIFMESALFSSFEENFRPEKSALFSRFKENFRRVWRFSELWPSKIRFGQNVLRMIWKEHFVQFSWKVHCFSVEDDFRPVWRFWKHWRSKMRFRQNVLSMTWKERFVKSSWKAHCFKVLARTLSQCDDFKNFDPQKCDLPKTCCVWPKKSVLYNFPGKRTVFPFWREFETSVEIFNSLSLKNAILAKRAAHDVKRAFCINFMKSALFSLFGENLRRLWPFSQLWRSQMRFGQNVLRMTWKERLYNFHGKRTVLKFWPEL